MEEHEEVEPRSIIDADFAAFLANPYERELSEKLGTVYPPGRRFVGRYYRLIHISPWAHRIARIYRARRKRRT